MSRAFRRSGRTGAGLGPDRRGHAASAKPDPLGSPCPPPPLGSPAWSGWAAARTSCMAEAGVSPGGRLVASFRWARRRRFATATPPSPAPAAMPTNPFLEGLSGRVPIPAPAAMRSSRLFDDFRAPVLFLAGRKFDANRAIAPPRPPFFLFFGLRPADGLVLLFLVLVGIGFLRWLVVGEWRWRQASAAERCPVPGP
jgi:hypothetical protein